jgi:hypothetical protein
LPHTKFSLANYGLDLIFTELCGHRADCLHDSWRIPSSMTSGLLPIVPSLIHTLTLAENVHLPHPSFLQSVL